jgi:hypothetical protein
MQPVLQDERTETNFWTSVQSLRCSADQDRHHGVFLTVTVVSTNARIKLALFRNRRLDRKLEVKTS